MKIYYVGQLWTGSTTRERMHELAKFGHDIVPFDTTPWVSGGNRLWRSIGHRFNVGPNVTSLNRAIDRHSRDIGSAELVWIDKGRWIYPEVLHAIREATGARLLHYTPDPQLLHHQSRHFQSCIPIYDWIVTTKPYEVESYRLSGARKVQLVLQGFDQRFLEHPRLDGDEPRWASDVCFVGHMESSYEDVLGSVDQRSCRLRVWGPGWSRLARRRSWAKACVAADGAWGDDYIRVLAGAKIGLGLLSKRIPDATTTRTFEIPAAGCFLLAERSDEHQSLFTEGREAEFFSTSEELNSKIAYYLGNEKARSRIAAAGRERSIKSGYSSQSQLRTILRSLVSSFGIGE